MRTLLRPVHRQNVHMHTWCIHVGRSLTGSNPGQKALVPTIYGAPKNSELRPVAKV